MKYLYFYKIVTLQWTSEDKKMVKFGEKYLHKNSNLLQGLEYTECIFSHILLHQF